MKKTAISVVLVAAAFFPQSFAAKNDDTTLEQVKSTTIPLPKVFERLSKTTGKQFFYSLSDIADIRVEEKKINFKSLNVTLAYLKSNFAIDYIIKNNTVTIRKSKLKPTNLNAIYHSRSIAQDTLKPREQSIEGVVITGQGSAISKKRISTKVTTIDGEDLEKIPSQRIDNLLATQLPNAQINLTGGQAGSTSLIRARGVNSAFLNSTPIIYLDGVRLDNLNTRTALGGSAQGSSMSAIADIPMDNIEKIEYINGGAATTLYGSDAANGVIQIFTKKGGKRGTNFSLTAENGIETPTNDFLHFKRTKDLLFENGYYQRYRLNINGKTEKDFGYNFSGSFFNSSGVQIHNQNENQKIDFSTGFQAKLAEKLKYESSFMYVRNQYKRSRNGNQGGYTGLWFTESGSSKITGPGFNNRLDEMSEEEFQAIKAFVDNAERLQDNQITVNRFTTSQIFKYDPLKNLNFRFTGGLDYRMQDQNTVTTNEYLTATRGTPILDQGSISNIQRNYLGITLELTGQHKLDFNNFSFITSFGGQLFRNEDRQILFSGTNIRDGAQTITDAAVRTSDEFLTQVLNYGAYIQENIGFKDKLFLDLGLRGDRNPAFGKNIGTQFYPKAGVSYVISSEPWFENKIINSLRLRGSYGIAGNLPPAYANERTIRFGGFGGQQAAFFGQPGNDNLRPEKTETAEGGFDVAFLNNRINFSAGYYRSLTRDALFYIRSAPSTGFNVSQLHNIGKIENKGFEFSLNVTPIDTKDMTLSFNTSLNTLDNVVLDSGGAPAFNINGFSERTLQTVVQEGQSIGFIRGNYGVFDENGVLSESLPQQNLGNTIPTLFGNIGLNFRYKKINFFANASYQAGAYAANWDAQFRYYYGASEDYIPAGEIEANGRVNWLQITNRFVEKTDFLKVRNIGMSYDIIPENKTFFKSLNIGFSAANPFNFTSSSFDPEATLSGASQGQGGASTGGISYATYSAPRQFILSLKFNF